LRLPKAFPFLPLWLKTKGKMKMTQNTLMMVAVLMLLGGCSLISKTSAPEKRKPVYRIQLGSNKGGIVENTDMSVVPGAGVDAFTGATVRGLNAGAKVLLPLKYNSAETGIEIMSNKQVLTYNDQQNNFVGERFIALTQFMVPLTYSIGIFKKNAPEGLIQLKFGYLAQFNHFRFDTKGQLPDYSTKIFSSGAVLGLSTCPFKLGNGNRIGVFMDAYRGSPAYHDYYTRPEFEMTGTAFVKYGIIYQF
jgi:hypothetical protein